MADLPFNEQMTEQLQDDVKTQSFLEWLKENGAVFDSVQFPAAFG